MTKRFKRLRDFDLELRIKRDDFVRPPREAQRNWLLNRAINEFVDDLTHIDALASRFVPGQDAAALADRTQLDLRDDEIMEDWQIPLMEAMADVVTESHGDILEVGFGIGVSACAIQDRGVRSHTIIECNDFVVARYERWRQAYPDADIRLVHGRWQDTLGDLGAFDGIFFHTYPLNEEERLEHISPGTTFASHFVDHAAAHLRPGGVFTYLTNEIDSLGRGHQRLLLKHFDSITVSVVDSLELPEDVRDAWWADSMVVVGARRRAEPSPDALPAGAPGP